MATIELSNGIPAIELCSASGEKINLAGFAGHDLVALFCPLDPDLAAAEIAAYLSQAAQFVSKDAWLVAFADQSSRIDDDGGRRILTVPDLKRHAWTALRDLTPCPEEMDRDSGATFLFTRGGSLRDFWHGSGHLDDVLAELGKPPSAQPDR